MKTRNLGIVIDQGADFSLVIGIFGDSGPIDITGYKFLSQMRKTTGSTSVAEFSFTILDQVTNKGQVKWYMPSATITAVVTSVATPLTEQRETTPFVFDVKMKDSVGFISRIIQGIIYVSPQATQEVFT